MKIRAQIHSYLEEIFIFQARVFKFGDCLGVWKLATNAKFQNNISKIMPARPKNTGTWEVLHSIKS